MSDIPPDNSPALRRVELPVREFNDRAERVNRSFIPEDLQKEESDLLFRVPFALRSAEGEVVSEVWIYVLLEHQSKLHPLMPLRVCSLCGILKHNAQGRKEAMAAANRETITREEFDKRLDESNEQRRNELKQAEAEQTRVEELLTQYERTLDEVEAELRADSELPSYSVRLRKRLQELASKTTEVAASL